MATLITTAATFLPVSLGINRRVQQQNKTSSLRGSTLMCPDNHLHKRGGITIRGRSSS